MTICLIFLVTFVLLFIRECKLDRKKHLNQDMRGDIHILKEFKKLYEEKNLEARKFDTEIKNLEDRLKKL